MSSQVKAQSGETHAKRWSLYLLFDGKNSYIGISTNIQKRLKQHNGELKGGARATRKSQGKWMMVAVIHGFNGRSEAQRWERYVKKGSRGVHNRYKAMQELAHTGTLENITSRQVNGLRIERIADFLLTC